MRALQKLLKQAQLMHGFKSRGMDRVAAEVAQEVRMLFENRNIDSGSCKQKAKHHASGTSSRDTASDPKFFCRRRVVRHLRLLLEKLQAASPVMITRYAGRTIKIGNHGVVDSFGCGWCGKLLSNRTQVAIGSTTPVAALQAPNCLRW